MARQILNQALLQETAANQAFDWSNLYLGFDGRIDREDFWCGALGLVALLLVVALVASFLPGLVQDFVLGIAYTASLYPIAALMSKRLQDRNKGTAYLALFLGLPVFFSIFNLFGPDSRNSLAILLSTLYLPVMLWALIELCILRGTPGSNRFGPQPE
ncbi:MAG: DUF805 domain-containing protein [Beijerinckiaceae bacterium]|jgi:uncharacterized membrane protein YhaH (DUF805 family)|nr:DUF805 domain-containing protein [Beijerinckiaceae bacterium]